MGLEEYRRKRDFTKTAEPAPRRVVKKSKGELTFVIQKHDATRLHYDFRLELDGVLLSWAVTRGPSLDPADKRLAVRTEDHPISYGTFEGTIPQGEYGGGTVMLWDFGTWSPDGDPRAGLKKGHIKFHLDGERLKGGWALIRMHGGDNDKRENWLLVKEKDDEAKPGTTTTFLEKESFSVKTGRRMEDIAEQDATPPSPKARQTVRQKVLAGVMAGKPAKSAKPKSAKSSALLDRYADVQLATLVDAPPAGQGWVHEIKFDGYRLLGFLDHGAVTLRTRNGNDWTDKFPAIRDSLSKMKAKQAVLDMEAVVVDDQGRTSFQALQNSLGENGNTQDIQAYVFDLLHLDGKDLSAKPLLNRKKKLEALLKSLKDDSILHYSDHVEGKGAEMIHKSCTLGLEGVVSKRADAAYTPGRGEAWLKSKCIKRQEFIIIGFNKAKSGPRAIGALQLGYYKDGVLAYAGKVGTGFSNKTAEDLYAVLSWEVHDDEPIKNLPATARQGAIWVKPRLLCEIAFTELTKDGHIRHPSFQGLREDKQAADVTIEKPKKVKTVAPASSAKPAKKTSAPGGNGRLDVLGVSISHPERIDFADVNVTKGDLAEYYAVVAPYILADIANHPVSMLRCPEGTKGECFFQRNPAKGMGPHIHPFDWKYKNNQHGYLYVDDAQGLLELVQMNGIEIHPWGATIDKIDYPDRIVFDFDPAPDVPFEAVKLAALDARQRLHNIGLESFLKCTGGKGLHVVVPLAQKQDWSIIKPFARAFAEKMAADTPEAYIATMSKAKRTGKIFIDYLRNDYTSTSIADYAVRARPGAPVAVPLEWSELKTLSAGNQFTLRDVIKRVQKKKPDLTRHTLKQTIPKSALKS